MLKIISICLYSTLLICMTSVAMQALLLVWDEQHILYEVVLKLFDVLYIFFVFIDMLSAH